MTGFRPINENRVLGDSDYEEDNGYGYDPENAGMSRGSFSSGGGAASKCKRALGCLGLTVVLGGAIGGAMYGYISFGPDGTKGTSASSAAALAPPAPAQDLVELCSVDYMTKNTEYDCETYCQDGQCCFMADSSGESCNLNGENAATCDKYSPCSALVVGMVEEEVIGGEYYEPGVAQENGDEDELIDEYVEEMEEEYEYEEAVEEAEEEYYKEIAEEENAEGGDVVPMDIPPAICSNGDPENEICEKEKIFCQNDKDCDQRTNGEFPVCSESCGSQYEDSLRDDVKGIMEEIEEELPPNERLYCAKSTSDKDVPVQELAVDDLQCFGEKTCVADDDCDVDGGQFCDPRCGPILFDQDGENLDDEEKKEPLEEMIGVGICGSAESDDPDEPVQCDPDSTPCMTADDCATLPSPFDAACVMTCAQATEGADAEKAGAEGEPLMFCGVPSEDNSELPVCTETACTDDSECDGEGGEFCMDECEGSASTALPQEKAIEEGSGESFYCGQTVEEERDCDFNQPCSSDAECESPLGCMKECLADFNEIDQDGGSEENEEAGEEEEEIQVVPAGMPPAPGSNATLPEFPKQCVKVLAGEVDCSEASKTCDTDKDCGDSELCSSDCAPSDTTSPEAKEGGDDEDGDEDEEEVEESEDEEDDDEEDEEESESESIDEDEEEDEDEGEGNP